LAVTQSGASVTASYAALSVAAGAAAVTLYIDAVTSWNAATVDVALQTKNLLEQEHQPSRAPLVDMAGTVTRRRGHATAGTGDIALNMIEKVRSRWGHDRRRLGPHPNGNSRIHHKELAPGVHAARFGADSRFRSNRRPAYVDIFQAILVEVEFDALPVIEQPNRKNAAVVGFDYHRGNLPPH
jgi:hypothetical protein